MMKSPLAAGAPSNQKFRFFRGKPDTTSSLSYQTKQLFSVAVVAVVFLGWVGGMFPLTVSPTQSKA